MKTQQQELIKLRSFRRSAKSKKHRQKLVSDALQGSFTTTQAAVLSEKKTIRKWSEDDIIQGLVLRSMSSKAYQYLRSKNLLPLPANSTLKNWVKSFRCQPGMQNDILKILSSKINSEGSELPKLASLAFDEMNIAECLEYDASADRVFGPHKKVQVAMLRGICQKWKQPVFFDFDVPMKLDLLFRIIISAESQGIEIWDIAFDLGNAGLMGELGVSEDRPYFPNPFDPERPIFAYPDPPHMLKLARNHLLDQGFTLEDGTEVTRRDFEAILLKDCSELKVCHKLTQHHLDVKGSARQNVRVAAQLLSHSTATALKCFGKEKQADFVETVNNWFDVLNSRLEFDPAPLKCAYGLKKEEQDAALLKMANMISKARVKNRKGLLPFQKGILIGIKSLMAMFQELKSRYPIRYLKTHCTNQDVVENFFSRVRALGATHTHPGPVAAKNRIRLLLLGNEADIIVKTAPVEFLPEADGTEQVPMISQKV